MAHLAGASRKRIAFLGAVDAPEAAQRFEGYKQGLAEAGLPFDASLVVPAPCAMEEAQEAITAFLATGVSFDAAFAFSDIIALAAIGRPDRGRQERAGRGGGGVGFDDIVLARHSTPPLTTIRQDLAFGARAMVDLLFRRMAGEDAPGTLSPVELVGARLQRLRRRRGRPTSLRRRSTSIP